MWKHPCNNLARLPRVYHDAAAELAIIDDDRAALGAIRDGPAAWSGFEELAARGVAAETLVGLYAAGWLEPWEQPQGLSWTLSPWGAEQLGVVVVEDVLGERQWWGLKSEELAYCRVAREAYVGTILRPEDVPAPGSPLLDEVSGREVRLFEGPGRPRGVEVLIDPKLAKPVRRKRGRKQGA